MGLLSMIHILLCVLLFNTVTCQDPCQRAQLELGECLRPLSNATIGDEVLCSQSCRSVIYNYYQLCIGITSQAIEKLCQNTASTQNTCRDSQLALVTNVECSQALNNATLGDEVLCGETCYGLLTNYFQDCSAGFTLVVDLLCGSDQMNSTGTPNTCYESELELGRDTECSQVLTHRSSLYDCEETCFSLVNNYYELCLEPTDAICYKLRCGNNGPIGNIQYSGTDDDTCHNSRVALITSSECSQALSNAAPGNEVLCGETCYGLLSDFYQNCAGDIQLINLFCGTYGSTCSNAYDNLYANSMCLEAFENDGIRSLRDNMTCQILLSNVYSACDFLDARIPEFYLGEGECYEGVIAAEDAGCSYYDNNALSPSHMACSQDCRAQWKAVFNMCDFFYDPVTESRLFDEACGITSTVPTMPMPSAAHTTRGLQLVSFIYCLIIALLSF